MKYIPTFYVNNIFEIPMSFYKKHNVRTILCDLDNTLDGYYVKTPSNRVIEFKKKLDKEDIKLFIISNNKGDRVKNYAAKLNVSCLSSAGKPFAFKIKKFLKNNNLNTNECVLIGDQLLTDIKAGIKSGIRTILCDKLVEKDQFTTRFNRLIDNPKRKRLIKKGLIKHEEFHD